jgi:hypothetical protein
MSRFDRLGRCRVADLLRKLAGRGGDSVGDALVDDAQDATDPAQAHPFEIEPHRLLVDGDAMALLLRRGRKAASAVTTPIALCAGTIATPLPRPRWHARRTGRLAYTCRRVLPFTAPLAAPGGVASLPSCFLTCYNFCAM